MEASEATKRGRVDQGSAFLALSLTIRLGAACAFAAAGLLGLLSFDWPGALTIALFAMTGYVVLETAVLYLWARPYIRGMGGGTGGGGGGNAYADAAKIAITTQGVVLGLVAFQEGRLPNTTLRVAASALVAGVLLAGILYLNVASGSPPDIRRAFAAAVLFSLVYWCLGFGLICVVAGSWS
jgi:hypothetical protein